MNIKLKSKILSVALAATMPLVAMAQTTTKLTASKANDYGIAYSLPNTVFDITFETELTVKQPGEFCNYANLYLNANDAITEPEYSAKLKSVTIVPRGVPDNENRWMMEFKGQGMTYVMLDKADVPVAINTENLPDISSETLPQPTKPAPTPLEGDALRHAMTQEMAASTSESKRAFLASQRIYELRQNRSDLISGQAENTPPDGKAMSLALDNLAAQEAALTAMFIGTEKSWTEVETFEFSPDESDVNNLVIARLSQRKGLVDADDLSGAPIYLNLEVLSNGQLPTDANGQPKKEPKGGVAYTIPGTARITISYEGRTLLSRDYEIAQLGKTFFLDPKIFTDKKAPSFMIFNPVTGGITEIGTVER